MKPLWKSPKATKVISINYESQDLIDKYLKNDGHGTGGSDQDHPQGKEMQKGKMVV